MYYEDYSPPPTYGNTYGGEVYYSRGDSGYGRGYSGDNDYRRHPRHDHDRRDHRRDRDDVKMTIEDAQYESVNGRRIDANRYVRDECHGENNCDVKASNKIFGDPDVGARKDLVVRYRCGRGPTRTVRVPEKSEQDIKC
jgi:hypothetical protein